MQNPYNPQSLTGLILSAVAEVPWPRCTTGQINTGDWPFLWPFPIDGIILSCSIKYKFISGCGDRTALQPRHPAQEAWNTSLWPKTILKTWIPTSCFAMSSLAQSPSCWTLSTCPTTEHPTSVSAQHLTSAQKEKKVPMEARLTLSRMRMWVIQPLHRIFSMLWDFWRASWPATHTDYIISGKIGLTTRKLGSSEFTLNVSKRDGKGGREAGPSHIKIVNFVNN